jgi:hypothetical protein
MPGVHQGESMMLTPKEKFGWWWTLTWAIAPPLISRSTTAAFIAGLGVGSSYLVASLIYGANMQPWTHEETNLK